jgi:hypothetical protein
MGTSCWIVDATLKQKMTGVSIGELALHAEGWPDV